MEGTRQENEIFRVFRDGARDWDETDRSVLVAEQYLRERGHAIDRSKCPVQHERLDDLLWSSYVQSLEDETRFYPGDGSDPPVEDASIDFHKPSTRGFMLVERSENAVISVHGNKVPRAQPKSNRNKPQLWGATEAMTQSTFTIGERYVVVGNVAEPTRLTASPRVFCTRLAAVIFTVIFEEDPNKLAMHQGRESWGRATTHLRVDLVFSGPLTVTTQVFLCPFCARSERVFCSCSVLS